MKIHERIDMQMTTREAVELALRALADYPYETKSHKEKGDKAIKLLCDHYGFNMNDFIYAEAF